jgi:hypothetical protein
MSLGIPVSSVSQARTLAENGIAIPTVEEPKAGNTNGVSPTGENGNLNPPSPTGANPKRMSTGGNTTKVLADLHAGVLQARTALENTRGQLKMAQRSVAQVNIGLFFSQGFSRAHTLFTVFQT